MMLFYTEFLDVIGKKVLCFFLLAFQSPLLTDFNPPPPPPWLKVFWNWFCNVSFVFWNLKSENSQDYAQKPQQNCTFMNLASVFLLVACPGYLYTQTDPSRSSNQPSELHGHCLQAYILNVASWQTIINSVSPSNLRYFVSSFILFLECLFFCTIAIFPWLYWHLTSPLPR